MFYNLAIVNNNNPISLDDGRETMPEKKKKG
jgi:hypothetical protein